MKLMHFIRLAILILASSFAANAEPLIQSSPLSSTGKLAGLVLDQGGARIPAAKVIVQRKGLRREVMSADDGSYEISLPKGKYTVSVTRDGFSPLRKQYVRIRSKATTKLNITLKGILIEEFPVQMEELRTEPLIINKNLPQRKPKIKP
jgi:hypothetical protein